jgi:hypothetical protein
VQKQASKREPLPFAARSMSARNKICRGAIDSRLLRSVWTRLRFGSFWPEAVRPVLGTTRDCRHSIRCIQLELTLFGRVRARDRSSGRIIVTERG